MPPVVIQVELRRSRLSFAIFETPIWSFKSFQVTNLAPDQSRGCVSSFVFLFIHAEEPAVMFWLECAWRRHDSILSTFWWIYLQHKLFHLTSTFLAIYIVGSFSTIQGNLHQCFQGDLLCCQQFPVAGDVNHNPFELGWCLLSRKSPKSPPLLYLFVVTWVKSPSPLFLWGPRWSCVLSL